jgi:hypothetical protein
MFLILLASMSVDSAVFSLLQNWQGLVQLSTSPTSVHEGFPNLDTGRIRHLGNAGSGFEKVKRVWLHERGAEKWKEITKEDQKHSFQATSSLQQRGERFDQDT